MPAFRLSLLLCVVSSSSWLLFGYLAFTAFAFPYNNKINRSNSVLHIYTTKIDGVVCPPNISETVAGRLVKLAHRQRIASTTIELISKKNLLSILSILVKTIQRIVADPKLKLSPPFDSADSVPSRSPCPRFGQNAVAIYWALRLPSLGDRDRSPGFG